MDERGRQDQLHRSTSDNCANSDHELCAGMVECEAEGHGIHDCACLCGHDELSGVEPEGIYPDDLAGLLHDPDGPFGRAIHEDAYAMQVPSWPADACRSCLGAANWLRTHGVTLAGLRSSEVDGLRWLRWALPIALRESILRSGTADEATWTGVAGDGLDADHVLAGTLMVTLAALTGDTTPKAEPEPRGAEAFDAAVQRAFEGAGVEVRTSFTPTDASVSADSTAGPDMDEPDGDDPIETFSHPYRAPIVIDGHQYFHTSDCGWPGALSPSTPQEPSSRDTPEVTE